MIVIYNTVAELGYDRFHPYPERTYRVLSDLRNAKGNGWKLASTPLPLRDLLAAEKGVVEDAVSLYPALKGTAGDGNKEITINGAFTTPSFFRIFGFALNKGNTATALQQPNSIVLSYETAQRFFGSTAPIGKMISIGKMGNFQVTGVLQPRTEKSHIAFDAYASAGTIPQLEKNGLLPEKSLNWDTYADAYTYVLLQPGVKRSTLEGLLNRIVSGVNQDPSQGSIRFPVQSLTGITPSWDDIYNDIGGGSGWPKLLGALGVGLIILVSACFNYTNLSIARSLTRAREVGIRKVSGATRSQLFAQYILEAVLISLLALGLSYLLLVLFRRSGIFNVDYENIPELVLTWKVLLVFLGFSLFTGLLAGTLPAWILSSFKPAEVLKSMPSWKVFGKINLRKSLIVFQLSLSLVVIIFLFAFYRQFHFMATTDPGFNAENILSIQLQGNKEQLLKQELAALSGTTAVSAASGNLGLHRGDRMTLSVSKEKGSAEMNYYNVDSAFLPMMGLKLVAGSNFGGQQALPQLLLNEQAVLNLGFLSPEAAVDKLLWLNDTVQAQVRGVVRDFHYEQLGRAIAPLAFRTEPGNYSLVNVKVHADKEKFLQQVKAGWEKLYPGQPLQTSWLQETLYRRNAKWGDISFLGYLALMTVVIAVLGLLALVIYATALRRKEIGVRKVMGAGVGSLVILLSRGFLRLLLIAGCIALPIGYLLSNLFLQNFPLRISFGIGSLVLCFGLLLLIGLMAIISQTWRAALMNPTRSLKND